MSLTLRQVSQRAGGGEIIRSQALPPEAIIGRDPACEIHLPDLSLALRHARLSEEAPGRVRIEGLEGQRFRLNGRWTRKAVLAAAQRQVIGLGEYELKLEQGEAEGETVLALAARGPPAPPDERAVFAATPRLFGRRGLAWMFAVLIASLCLAAPILVFHTGVGPSIVSRQWLTGHLSSAHAFMENDCGGCHAQAFGAVRDTACLECHQPALAQAAADTARRIRTMGGEFAPLMAALHAKPARLAAAMPPADHGWRARVEARFRQAFNRPADTCASCHGEHAHETPQADPPGASRPASRPALHPTAGCVDCHGGLKARLKDTGLSDVKTWNGHPDFRPQVMVQPGEEPVIRRLNAMDPWRENNGLVFSHAQHLASGGSVARMGSQNARYGGPMVCADCHRLTPDKTSFQPVTMQRECAACHSLALAPGVSVPHGDPAKAVNALRAFYQSGGPVGAPTSDRRAPGLIAELSAQAARLRNRFASPGEVRAQVVAAFAPGGLCADCHTVRSPGDGSLNFRIAPVSLAERYGHYPGAFDHALPEHRQTPQGQEGCAGCHGAAQSPAAGDLLIPHMKDCAACHGQTKPRVPLAASGDCETCHSFHLPSRTPVSRRLGVARPPP